MLQNTAVNVASHVVREPFHVLAANQARPTACGAWFFLGEIEPPLRHVIDWSLTATTSAKRSLSKRFSVPALDGEAVVRISIREGIVMPETMSRRITNFPQQLDMEH